MVYFDGSNYDTFALDRRLADQCQESLRRFEDLKEVHATGDNLSTEAVTQALAGLPAALAILLGSITQAVRDTRKALFLWAGTAALAASIAMAITLEVVTFQ